MEMDVFLDQLGVFLERAKEWGYVLWEVKFNEKYPPSISVTEVSKDEGILVEGYWRGDLESMRIPWDVLNSPDVDEAVEKFKVIVEKARVEWKKKMEEQQRRTREVAYRDMISKHPTLE